MSVFEHPPCSPLEESRQIACAGLRSEEQRRAEAASIDHPHPDPRSEAGALAEWIDVTEFRSDEQFEASFFLRLAGVSAKHLSNGRSRGEWPSATEDFDVIPLVRLVERVGAPLRVELRHAASGASAVECLIGSRVRATTRGCAIAGATALLARMVEATGRSAASYMFEPSMAIRDQGATLMRLARPSLLLGPQSHTPAGFHAVPSAPHEAHRDVRVPLCTSWGRLDATTRALASAGAPICLRFDLTARQLSRADVAGLIQVQLWLSGPLPAALTHEQLAKGDVPKDSGFLHGTRARDDGCIWYLPASSTEDAGGLMWRPGAA